MSLTATVRSPRAENFGGGVATSVLLHAAITVALIVGAVLTHYFRPDWGDHAQENGSIAISAVNSIPLPTKAPPVDKNVLVNPDVSKAPEETAKVKTQPPPPPDAVAIKKETPKPVKEAPKVADVAPHPQPTPPTPKANSGSAATQIPTAVQQVTHGTASMTVANHIFGERYAYYFRTMQQIIGQNWYTQEVDPASSAGKSVVISFDVNADGIPINIRIKTPSGSKSLDQSVLHALQRIQDQGFGPLPDGSSIPIEDTFTYHQ